MLVRVRLCHVDALYMYVDVTKAVVNVSFVLSGRCCFSTYFLSGKSAWRRCWLRCVSSGCRLQVGVMIVPRCL